MSNLVISKKAVDLASDLEFTEGQITIDVEQKMIELAASVDGAARFLDRADSIVSELKNKKEKISKKINTLIRAQEFVESELRKSISVMGDLEGEEYIFKLQKIADKVELDENVELSDLYLRTKVTHEPNKDLIYGVLKTGQAIEGARLVPNFSLKKTLNTKKIKDIQNGK